MALSIKSGEADRLARQLAAETGASLTAAVIDALRVRTPSAAIAETASSQRSPGSSRSRWIAHSRPTTSMATGTS
ncbi:MAG TPA: type II toxin-antitoxin system VapB family antitoxin [Acidimicrobiales bacterium]